MNYTENQNTVNDSVSFIKDNIPKQFKDIAYMFRKNTKLIESLMREVSEYKSGILLKNLCETTGIPFTKLLLMLDKNAFTELHVFLRNKYANINDWQGSANVKGYGRKEVYNVNYIGSSQSEFQVAGETGRVLLSSIRFRHMQTPYCQLVKFIQGTNFPTVWNLKNTIVPLRVIPKIMFEGMKPNRANYFADPMEKFQYDPDKFTKSKDVNIFGVGIKNSIIECDMEIDIESIFTLMWNHALGPCIYGNNYYKWDSKASTDKDIHEDKIREILHYLNIFNSLSDEEFEEKFITCFVLPLANRMIYSASITFLATVTKVDEINYNFIANVSNEILNIAVDNLYEDSYIAHEGGDGAKVKKGALIRLLSSNIGAMMQAMLMSVNEESTYNSQGNISYFIKGLVGDLFSLRYQTWNYIKIPTDNIKFRKIYHIGSVAKKSTYLLDMDNKLTLNLIYDEINKNDNKVLSAFGDYDAIRVNAPYSNNKRFLDLGRSLLQSVCYMVILRYRISSLNTQKEYSTDELTLNRKDYFDLNRTAFTQLRRVIGTLNSKMFSLINNDKGNLPVGDHYLEYSSDNNNNAPSGRKHFMDFIYGLTDETSLKDTTLQECLSNYTMPIGDPSRKTKYVHPEIKEIRRSINEIAKRFDEDRGYVDIPRTWIEILKTRITDVISSPFSERLITDAFAILEICEDYNRLPYSKLHTSVDSTAINKMQEPDTYDSFGRATNTISDAFKQQHKMMSDLSVEALENIFKNIILKRGNEIAPGIVGTMNNVSFSKDETPGIFNDVAGYDFTLGLTEQTLTMEPNVEEGIIPSQEVIKSHESLRTLIKKFDKYLGEKY
jgi:hypothetical protein